MKNILINIAIGVICFFAGLVTAKHIYDLFKMIPGYLWIGSAILVFVWLILYFFYKMFNLFPDIFSENQENDKGGINK